MPAVNPMPDTDYDDSSYAVLCERMTSEQLVRAENGWWQSAIEHANPHDPFGKIARAHVHTCQAERKRRDAAKAAA